MRTYHEPVAVLFRGAPAQFIWRGRLLLVKEVHALSREASPWWLRPEDGATDLLREREIWRVEAGNGRLGRGIYELARTVGQDDWVLQAVAD